MEIIAAFYLLKHLGVAWTCLIVPFLPFLFLFPAVPLALMLKWGLVGRIRSSQHPTYGYYFRLVWLVEKITKDVTDLLGDYFANTIVLTWWLRALGCTIGENV